MRARFFIALLCVGMMLHSSSFAATWIIDEENNSGQSFRWNNGEIIWHAEDVATIGDFAGFSKLELLQLVQSAFKVWADAGIDLPSGERVPTAAVSAGLGGLINKVPRPSGNFNLLEYEPLLKELAKKTVVIFDADGDFVTSQSVAAETYIGAVNRDKKLIRTGVIIINGQSNIIKNAVDITNPQDPHYRQLKATIIHEIGHLYNLDHCVLNEEAHNLLGHEVDQLLTTMNPAIERPDQDTLHKADVANMSNIYPRASFTDRFCEVVGQVIGSDGLGFQGAYIYARSSFQQDAHFDAVAAISGNQYRRGTADGTYALRGLIPGRPYIIRFMEIGAHHTGMSGLGRYGVEAGDSPRSGFGEGVITAGNGVLSQVMCEEGGQTIVMDTIQFDIPAGGELPPSAILTNNDLGPVVDALDAESTGDAGSSGEATTSTTAPPAKAGCSLILPHLTRR